MLDELPKSISHEAFLTAMVNIDMGVAAKYKESTHYDVVYEGRRFSPKQLVGEAAFIQLGQRIDPASFKGGVGTKCFRLIEKAGFSIIAKKVLIKSPEPSLSHLEDDVKLEAGDSRKVAYMAIKQRRGQKKFRESLITLHQEGCQISGCMVESVLEAAHIKPYKGSKDNHPSNGLLLRADIHTLFDLELIRVDPENLHIAVHESLDESDYWQYNGTTLRIDAVEPNKEALIGRWKGEY